MNPSRESTQHKPSIYQVDVTSWQPILWREWNQRRKILLLLTGAVLAFGFLLPIWDTVKDALIVTGVCSFVIGYFLGASDTSDGREAYAFTLPPRRSDLFWSRFCFGWAWSLGLLVASLAAVYLDLSAAFWGLFFESGLAAPATGGGFGLPGEEEKFAAFAIAILSFPAVFSITSLARSRAGGFPAALAGALLITVVPGFLAGILVWIFRGAPEVSDGGFFGMFNVLVPLMGILAVWFGFRGYTGRDAQPAVEVRGRSLLLPVFVLVFVIFVLISMSMNRISEVKRAEAQTSDERARAAQVEARQLVEPSRESGERRREGNSKTRN